MKNKMQIVDECKVIVHFNSLIFNTLFLLLLLFLNGVCFGDGMSNGAESEEILNTENFTIDSEENLYYQAACNYRELQVNADVENNYPINGMMQSTSIEQFYKIDKLISENRIEEAIVANRSISPVNLIEQNHQILLKEI